jgi:predicted DNA-binding transcriptional regulator AlpA
MNKLLTPAELAGLIGLATQTIYNRHSAGASLPPCVRIGRLVRFPQSGIEDWIAAQAETPASRDIRQQRRRPGRPTKAEQIMRRGGAS